MSAEILLSGRADGLASSFAPPPRPRSRFFFPPSPIRISAAGIALSLLLAGIKLASAASADVLFRDGIAAFGTADFKGAAAAFRQSAEQLPAAGTLCNLGNAEWRLGNVGPAIVAWEQALWLNPFERNSSNNLRFARTRAQIEAPELSWYEVASAWLPSNWWAWVAGASLWLVFGAVTLPTILRRRKTGWSQALAAVGLTVFLLSLPAHLGVYTRSHVAFVLTKNTLLRLTPTQEAQAVTRLAAGDPARWVRTRGNYFFIRTNHAAGWVRREELGLVCPP
jgi:tetratricopeptide (TPR) repeat protein